MMLLLWPPQAPSPSRNLHGFAVNPGKLKYVAAALKVLF
jgi:hypothetical protein